MHLPILDLVPAHSKGIGHGRRDIARPLPFSVINRAFFRDILRYSDNPKVEESI